MRNKKAGNYCSVVFGGLALAFAGVGQSEAAGCLASNLIRFQMNGIEYRIPAELQPSYSPPEALQTRDHFPQGRLAKQYCQSESDPPAVVQRISFPKEALRVWAQQNAHFNKLADINPFVINQTFVPPPQFSEVGKITDDGLFRRIDHGRNYELISKGPLLFDSPIPAGCGPTGTQQQSLRCPIRGRLRNESLVTLGVLDRKNPSESWPEMLAQVERFLSLLNH
jgi:hypothetical protein